MTDIYEIKKQIEERFTEIGELMKAGEALGYKARLWDSSCPHKWNDIKDDLHVEFSLTANAGRAKDN